MMAPNENAAPNTQPKAIAAPTLHVHAAGNSFIGNLEIDAHTATLEAPVANAQWCLVMDNSASMGRWSPRRGSNPRLARRRLLIQHSSRWLRSAALIHDVFPHMLRRMGVPEDELHVGHKLFQEVVALGGRRHGEGRPKPQTCRDALQVSGTLTTL